MVFISNRVYEITVMMLVIIGIDGGQPLACLIILRRYFIHGRKGTYYQSTI